jgi:hypothetical protein
VVCKRAKEITHTSDKGRARDGVLLIGGEKKKKLFLKEGDCFMHGGVML